MQAIDCGITGAWANAFFVSNFTHLTGGKRWARPGMYAELLAGAIFTAGTVTRLNPESALLLHDASFELAFAASK